MLTVQQNYDRAEIKCLLAGWPLCLATKPDRKSEFVPWLERQMNESHALSVFPFLCESGLVQQRHCFQTSASLSGLLGAAPYIFYKRGGNSQTGKQKYMYIYCEYVICDFFCLGVLIGSQDWRELLIGTHTS